MAINYGISSESRTREYSSSLVKVTSVSVSQYDDFPFYISYSIDSDIDTTATVELQYSTDGGSSWLTPTAVTGSPSHDNTSNISVSAASVVSQTFVWDAYPDLNPSDDLSFAGDIIVRIRAADASSNYTGWLNAESIYFSNQPIVSIRGIVDYGFYIDLDYTIGGYDSVYNIYVDYSTDGTTYQQAQLYNSSTTGSGTIARPLGNGAYSWFAQQDLGSFFNGSYYLRIRLGHSGTGIYTEYEYTEAINKTYLPYVSIGDLPTSIGNTMELPYAIQSDRQTTSLFDVAVSYSTDGTNFYAATQETSNPNHSGITGLSIGQHVFSWDIDADLQANQLIQGAVILKIEANDDISSADPVQTDPFSVNMVPSVSLASTEQIVDNTKIQFNIQSFNENETYSIEVEYSLDNVDFFSAPANVSVPGHSAAGLSKDTTYTYAWDSSTSLGYTFDGTYNLRARVTNGLPDTGGQAYNQYSAYSDILSASLDYTPSISLSSYPSNAITSSPIIFVYSIESYVSSTSIVYLEYSTDSGATWANATPDYTNPNHSGTQSANNGSSGISNGINQFIWDIHADLGTHSNISLIYRLKIYLTGPNYNYSEVQTLSTSSLPLAPSLIGPTNGYFDSGESEYFSFTIPTDIGPDNIHFKFDLIPSSGSGNAISKESNIDIEHFQHRVQQSSGLKQQDEIGILNFVSNVKVPTGSGMTFTYANYKDAYSEQSVGSPYDYEVCVVNKKDRRVYVSNKNNTSCTLTASAAGSDDYGLVDVILFDANSGVYFKQITQSNASTTHTFGAGDFVTDNIGRNIPSSISNCRPFLIEGTDRHFYLSNVSDTGFTLNKSDGGVGVSDIVTVCLIADSSKVYQHNSFGVSGAGNADVATSFLYDGSPSVINWPSYMPGVIVWSVDSLDRALVIRGHSADRLRFSMSAAGLSPNTDSTIFAVCTLDEYLPYYTNVSPNGVPDTYEGEYCRFVLRDLDTPSAGTYTWSVAAGNEA